MVRRWPASGAKPPRPPHGVLLLRAVPSLSRSASPSTPSSISPDLANLSLESATSGVCLLAHIGENAGRDRPAKVTLRRPRAPSGRIQFGSSSIGERCMVMASSAVAMLAIAVRASAPRSKPICTARFTARLSQAPLYDGEHTLPGSRRKLNGASANRATEIASRFRTAGGGATPPTGASTRRDHVSCAPCPVRGPQVGKT